MGYPWANNAIIINVEKSGSSYNISYRPKCPMCGHIISPWSFDTEPWVSEHSSIRRRRRCPNCNEEFDLEVGIG